MTRFARAAGSKASNKKIPEEGTPWRLLKTKMKTSDDNVGHSSGSTSQDGEQNQNPVGRVHSDKSNLWNVTEQPSTSSSSVNHPNVRRSAEQNDEPSPSNRTTGKLLTIEDRKILDNLKAKLLSERVDFSEILDRLEAKTKELVKKGVKRCFKCRGSGHTYKDCPEKDETEVCFVCGSTEHNFKDCKKKKRDGCNFAFATCFICKEQGHISSACPDNPTGLYPYGGGCHECGEVTHFSRDCPKKQKKTTKKQVTVDILSFDVEGLPEDKPTVKPQKPTKKIKIVNF